MKSHGNTCMLNEERHKKPTKQSFHDFSRNGGQRSTSWRTSIPIASIGHFIFLSLFLGPLMLEGQ